MANKTWRIQFLIDAPDDHNDLQVEGVVQSELEGMGFTFDGENYVDARDVTAEEEVKA